MVMLQLTATITTCIDNTIIINPGVEELSNFSQAIVTKKNGTRRQFRVILCSSVPPGAFHMAKMTSRIHRLHLGHRYHVESVSSSAIRDIKSIVDFSKMKTAGYAAAIKDIIEKVIAPRKFSPKLRNEFGMEFIRGVVLYGPPGTGKTFLIKSICEYFNLKPQIIYGAQLLDPLIGKSEEAVRLLFEQAEKDQKEKGDASPLHVFVFDEMDALFSKRTSSVSIVSQLSTKMDGYAKLNNILIFGTTNRLEMIDPALLRGGRFEMVVKIDFPTIQDRMEIINFHLSKPRENGRLASDITPSNLQQLAYATEKYSGANLAQVVRMAINTADRKLLKSPIVSLDQLHLEDEKKSLLNWNDLLYAFRWFHQQRQDSKNIIRANKIDHME